MGISRIIKKFEKVKKAVNSIKGIQSKIQSINYTTALDSLGESQEAAEAILSTRRDNLQGALGAHKRVGMAYSKKSPVIEGEEGALIYPKYDKLANYIFFVSRPRAQKANAKTSTGDLHPVFKRRRCALYIPDTLLSQSQVGYNQQGIGFVAKALEQIRESIMQGDGLNIGKEKANQLATQGFQAVLSQLTSGQTNIKQNRAINPGLEQLLDNVPFRSWDFTFDFWPKSQDEAQTVNEIIYFFRSSMLPDFYTDRLSMKGEKLREGVEVESIQEGENQLNANFMNYPNVFNISFKGPIGNKIDGFLPAVCTNAQVDYAGGQKFSTFADGQPVHIQLTLNFLEIQTMSLGNYDNIVIPDSNPMKTETGFSTTDSLTQQYGVDGDKFGDDG
tara:strand:- start:1630 stop:2796 length:1167 start_codon:yes stop_codon:yes gene_type:complete